MNPEQQRVAIAEACGWTAREDIENFWRAVDASGNMTHELWMSERNVWSAGIPNYLNDLNAMHDAEKTLTDKAHEEFRLNLYDVIGDDSRLIVSSTATQRAEAFLRTIGKWEESK